MLSTERGSQPLAIPRSRERYTVPFGTIPPRTTKGAQGTTGAKSKGKGRALDSGTRIIVREASPPEAHTTVSPRPVLLSTICRHASPTASTSTDSEGSWYCCYPEEVALAKARSAGTGGGLLSPLEGHNNGRTCTETSEEGAHEGGEECVSSPGDGASAGSATPSLSPSRQPLFDDDSGEDDDDYFPFTPSPTCCDSPSPTKQRRRTFTPTLAITDPLVSPPTLSFNTSSEPPSLRTHARTPSSSLSSSPPPATSARRESLLTKSLRSLTRLPNLSFPSLPSLPPLLSLPSILREPLSGVDIDGLCTMEDSPWEWRGTNLEGTGAGKSNWELERESFRQRASRGKESAVALARIYDGPIDEGEATMVVQLQTFTPHLPPPSPLPISIASPSQPIESGTPVVVSPPPPRVISNQRHLLMLSLEIEMMRAGKIVSPLRQRSVVIRAATAGTERRRSGLMTEYV
jgi:hypothetical protein